MKYRTVKSTEKYVEKRTLVNTVWCTAKCERWERLGRDMEEEDIQAYKKLTV